MLTPERRKDLHMTLGNRSIQDAVFQVKKTDARKLLLPCKRFGSLMDAPTHWHTPYKKDLG